MLLYANVLLHFCLIMLIADTLTSAFSLNVRLIFANVLNFMHGTAVSSSN